MYSLLTVYCRPLLSHTDILFLVSAHKQTSVFVCLFEILRYYNRTCSSISLCTIWLVTGSGLQNFIKDIIVSEWHSGHTFTHFTQCTHFCGGVSDVRIHLTEWIVFTMCYQTVVPLNSNGLIRWGC